jgi:ABC-2 type transport system ATP-binding protein
MGEASLMNLELELLSVEFRNFTLGPISVELSTGSVGLAGPNGAGKTTLLRAVAGLLTGTSGAVRLNGNTLDDLCRRTEIGFAGASSTFYPTVSFADHLAFLRQFYGTWSRDLEDELISRFRLPLRKNVGEASSGMVAKFALLISFARMSPCIMFDEPWNALDPSSRFELVEELSRLREESKRIIVLSSHDLGTLQEAVDRVIFLNDGQIVEITASVPTTAGLESPIGQIEKTYREIYR